MTFKPYSPNASDDPRHALPRRLPFCCLRNFTFFGINIAKTLKTRDQGSGTRDQFDPFPRAHPGDLPKSSLLLSGLRTGLLVPGAWSLIPAVKTLPSSPPPAAADASAHKCRRGRSTP